MVALVAVLALALVGKATERVSTAVRGRRLIFRFSVGGFLRS
jgi:hypothetical protein